MQGFHPEIKMCFITFFRQSTPIRNIFLKKIKCREVLRRFGVAYIYLYNLKKYEFNACTTNTYIIGVFHLIGLLNLQFEFESRDVNIFYTHCTKIYMKIL